MATKIFDLIIFGASGFTGEYVLEEVAKTAKKENVRFAVAGRSQAKLQQAIEEASKNTGEDLSSVEVIIADVSNVDSIMDMCVQAKVIVNCVGPYRFYGNVVVHTCVEVGCHYVDISGETEACGFDSIPADMGAIFTKQMFKGQLDYIESYFETKGGPDGVTVNDGTWKSLVYSLSTKSTLKHLRASIYKEPLPTPLQAPPKRSTLFFSDQVDAYCLPFSGSDRAIVKRTNYYNYLDRKVEPFDYKPYLVVRGYLLLLHLFFVGCILFLFTRFKAGVNLLVKHPRVMSLGLFSSEGPSRKQVQECMFEMTFVGRGSPAQTPTESSKSSSAPLEIVTKIVGPEPGYMTTPACMVQAAYVILKDNGEMSNFGVLTPGLAFEKTSLIKRLENRKISFEVLSAQET